MWPDGRGYGPEACGAAMCPDVFRISPLRPRIRSRLVSRRSPVARHRARATDRQGHARTEQKMMNITLMPGDKARSARIRPDPRLGRTLGAPDRATGCRHSGVRCRRLPASFGSVREPGPAPPSAPAMAARRTPPAHPVGRGPARRSGAIWAGEASRHHPGHGVVEYGMARATPPVPPQDQCRPGPGAPADGE